MEDMRKLVLFERSLGRYHLAGAICSYGDVIDFVDGSKQGIVLIDTCGHEKESGENMAAFLQEQISQGWGNGTDAREDLITLGKKLDSFRQPGEEFGRGEEKWYDLVSGLYVQFNDDDVSLSMGSGLGRTLIFKANSLEKILMLNGPIDHPKFEERSVPAYFFSLGQEEVLFLHSDGLIGNMAKSFYYKYGQNRDGEYCKDLIIKTIKKLCNQSVQEIRENLVSKYNHLFLPLTSRFDDVTFAVVKRK